jgi:hypothetical protein
MHSAVTTWKQRCAGVGDPVAGYAAQPTFVGLVGLSEGEAPDEILQGLSGLAYV